MAKVTIELTDNEDGTIEIKLSSEPEFVKLGGLHATNEHYTNAQKLSITMVDKALPGNKEKKDNG